MAEIKCPYRSNVHNEGDKPESFYEVAQCKLLDDFIWEGKGCAFIIKKTCEFCQKGGAPSLKNPSWMIICENHLKGPLAALKSGVIGTWQEKGFTVDKTIEKMKILGVKNLKIASRLAWAKESEIISKKELDDLQAKHLPGVKFSKEEEDAIIRTAFEERIP